jgi:RHS repeat-associated protein
LYNGKEMLDEDADLGWIDYGFRNYDPQIGRFPQLDPLTDEYPELTPYQYASCDPIENIDVDGLEGVSSLREVVVVGVRQAAPTGLSVTGNFLKGVGSSLWGTVTGVASAVVHPIQTVTGIAHAVSHPIQTAKALYGVAKETYTDFQNGNADTKANILGHAVGDIAQLFIGTGEAKAAIKVLRSTKIAKEAKLLSKSVNVYERVMSEAELLAARNNNLLRGGREGENFFSLEGTISNDAKRAQQRLGLDEKLRTHKVKFTIEDEMVNITGPRTAKAGKSGTKGGGTEFSTQQKTRIKIIEVTKLKNTGL